LSEKEAHRLRERIARAEAVGFERLVSYLLQAIQRTSNRSLHIRAKLQRLPGQTINAAKMVSRAVLLIC
jgi:hypothetical protein